MKFLPDRIWFRAYLVKGTLHFKTVDCEFGDEPDNAHIMHLIFHRKLKQWTGTLHHGLSCFVLTSRQAETLFIGTFPCTDKP